MLEALGPQQRTDRSTDCWHQTAGSEGPPGLVGHYLSSQSPAQSDKMDGMCGPHE